MIEIDQVWKRLGGHWVLRDVSLQVRRGEVLALVGPSGTGKSVLLKHIIGLMVPDRGDVRVHGESVVTADYRRLARMRRTMGYVFQDGALIDWMTIRENLLLALDDRERRADPEAAERRVRDVLSNVNLPESTLEKTPAQLSGGMRKRAGVARATLNAPDVVLYDEPTTGLDPQNVLAINEAILKVRRALGATSIVITHDMPSVAHIADRVAMLANGRIRFLGAVHEFFDSTEPLISAFRASTHQDAGRAEPWRITHAVGMS